MIKEKIENAFAFCTPMQRANTLINLTERHLRRPRLLSQPLTVQVEVTDRCNLNCFICSRWSAPFKGADLDQTLIDKVVELSKRSRELVLFGYGEPLIAKSFYELLEKAKSGRLSFVTNGFALSKRLAEKIKATASRPLYMISFSIDSADPDTYLSIRERSNLDRVWQNLVDLKSASVKYPKIWLDFVAMKRNVGELPQLIEKAAAIGVDTINVFNLVVWDESYADESLIRHQDLALQAFSEAAEAATKTGIKLNLPAVPGVKSGSRVAGPCNDPWSYAYIRQNGDVQACCFSDSMVMGNLRDHTFTEIWNNEAYQSLRLSVNSERPPVVCDACEQRWRNIGSEDDNKIYLKLKPKNSARMK